MRRPAALLLALFMLTATACSGKIKPPKPAPQGETPPPVTNPDLTAAKGSHEFTLAELAAGLPRYMNEATVQQDEPPLFKLLRRHWGMILPAGRLLYGEGDLNGDGSAELVVALTGKGGGVSAPGALFVLYQTEDGRWTVNQGEPMPGVRLHAVKDLTGDGKPEMIWSSTVLGAHTAFSRVFVSVWTPPDLLNLQGEMAMASMEVEIEGKELVLRGGTIGSVGAGAAQRARTDRYRWAGGAFRLADRRYAPSEYAYHKLIDGIVAEETGHLTEAAGFYRAVLEEGRRAIKSGEVPPEWETQFPQAVRAFARFRLGLLDPNNNAQISPAGPYAGLIEAQQGATDRDAACTRAADWAGANPEFLEALNSPHGYANPRWTLFDLCGPLPVTN